MIQLSEYLGDYFFTIYKRHYELIMQRPKEVNIYCNDIINILEIEFDERSVRQYKKMMEQYNELKSGAVRYGQLNNMYQDYNKTVKAYKECVNNHYNKKRVQSEMR